MLNFTNMPESAKVNKEVVTMLACRATHCVRLQTLEHKENDGTYAMYGNPVGQTAEFMRDWLHYFITVVYKMQFKRISFNYLSSKGLSLDLWVESIKDGRRPDFLVLLALNALLEMHAMVHVADGKIWTTMNNPPEEHGQLLEQCEYHLVFLGRGNFVEIVARDRPLIIIEETEDVKSLEIGRLTFDESSTLDSVIQRGLGVGIDPAIKSRKECTSEIKEEVHEPEPAGQKLSETETEKSTKSYIRKFGIKVCKVRLTRIDVKQIEKRTYTDEPLRESSDSDDTIIYSLGKIIKSKHNIEKPARRHISGHPSQTGFRISVHGIRKKKKRTYLFCKLVGCKSRFSCVRD